MASPEEAALVLNKLSNDLMRSQTAVQELEDAYR